jgi:predicted glutamine amidotransferase
MCKLLITTCPLDRKGVLRLLTETAIKFEDQQDGFGFAAFDKSGLCSAWGRYYPEYTGWKNAWKDEGIEIGELPETTHTLLIHGRTSTNVLGTKFCHPYKADDTYLIHNGVLGWVGRGCAPRHQNDSGAFLKWLVSNDFVSPNEWKNYWEGYGAMAIMRKDNPGLTVVKCNKANLVITAAKKSGYILTTRSYDIPRWLRDTKSKKIELASGVIQFDVEGEIQAVRKFSGFRPRVWDWKSIKSLGESDVAVEA